MGTRIAVNFQRILGQGRANSSRAFGQVAAMISAVVENEIAAELLKPMVVAIRGHETAISRTLKSHADYRITVSSLQTSTDALDRAKTRLGATLADYEAELTTSVRLLQGVAESVDEMWHLAARSIAPEKSAE